MFLMLSCGGDSKNNNDRIQGELYGECYLNETCNDGLVCDTEYNICIKDHSGDHDEKPVPDDSDFVDDSDDSMPDDDTIPPGPCDEDPCSGIEHSDGVCFETGEKTFSCGCETGYFWNWNNSKCKKSLSIGNICTNQKKCYNNDFKPIECPASSSDDFYGQDAQYSDKCTRQDITLGIKALAGTITDNNTGLVWQKSLPSHPYTWDKATDADDETAPCVMLNNEKHADINWRVPNALEFMTIADSNECRFAIHPNFDFTGISTALSIYLWTSDEFGTDTSQARVFNPESGSFLSGKSKSSKYYVLCVAGDELAPTPSTDFVISSDGMTVTDKRTGLIWQKEYDDSGKTWQEALKYCEDSVYAGYTDWRLPNKNELLSLLDPGKSSAPYSNFPDMPNHWFWSSTTDFCDAYYAWFVLFNVGNVSHYLKTNHYAVRCVRSE